MSSFPQQFEIWTADLNPSTGVEPGKTRPVVIIQADVLQRAGHLSTIICPVSSQVRVGVKLLRLPVAPTTLNGLEKESFILCDQIRAIDIKRLQEQVGTLEPENIEKLKESIRVILGLY